MRHFKTVTKTTSTSELIGITCDVCGEAVPQGEGGHMEQGEVSHRKLTLLESGKFLVETLRIDVCPGCVQSWLLPALTRKQIPTEYVKTEV